MGTQKERSETTRAILLETFKDIALKQGFDATTTEAVLARTGLSKGAFYHHFRSKTELAEAIYKIESHGAIDRAVRSVAASISAIERLKATSAAWLREVREPAVRRILFEIGPSALGIKRVIEIENSLSLKLFEDLLSQANANGEIIVAKSALAARLINAYVGEAALQKPADLSAAEATIGPVIDAILVALTN
jgi:AcrR family transcriptional regulator